MVERIFTEHFKVLHYTLILEHVLRFLWSYGWHTAIWVLIHRSDVMLCPEVLIRGARCGIQFSQHKVHRPTFITPVGPLVRCGWLFSSEVLQNWNEIPLQKSFFLLGMLLVFIQWSASCNFAVTWPSFLPALFVTHYICIHTSVKHRTRRVRYVLVNCGGVVEVITTNEAVETESSMWNLTI
jgi:hypothetical protein